MTTGGVSPARPVLLSLLEGNYMAGKAFCLPNSSASQTRARAGIRKPPARMPDESELGWFLTWLRRKNDYSVLSSA